MHIYSVNNQWHLEWMGDDESRVYKQVLAFMDAYPALTCMVRKYRAIGTSVLIFPEGVPRPFVAAVDVWISSPYAGPDTMPRPIDYPRPYTGFTLTVTIDDIVIDGAFDVMRRAWGYSIDWCGQLHCILESTPDQPHHVVKVFGDDFDGLFEVGRHYAGRADVVITSNDGRFERRIGVMPLKTA